MKILVTGATGFLGKRVCKKLDKRRLEYVRTSLSLGTDLRECGRCDRLWAEVKPDVVLHCASYVGGIQFGMKNQAKIFRNNLLMSVNLLENCAKYKVKRLVNPISNCAYPGDATCFKETEFWDGPLHETVRTYGAVRKLSQIGAEAYQKQYGLDTINLVLSNMYGPEDHFEEERSHALGALVMKMVEAKRKDAASVTVWGSGAPVREWLYVDDGAEAMVRAINIPSYADIINIGANKGISVKDLAVMIKEITAYRGELIFDAEKPDGAPHKTVDGAFGAKMLGWQPETKLEDGIRAAVKWYEEMG
jgi:GDP-L-fucose synthase